MVRLLMLSGPSLLSWLFGMAQEFLRTSTDVRLRVLRLQLSNQSAIAHFSIASKSTCFCED